MQLDFQPVFNSLPRLLDAAAVSLRLMLVAAVASFVIGLGAGQARMSRHWFIRLPATAYIDFFRTTPLLIQIVWMFFVLPIFFKITVGAFLAGAVALSLNYGAFFAEIFRAGVTSLGRGQTEAGAALGMSDWQVARTVVYPQAIRRMLPPIGSMFVSLLKDTSLVSVIGVAELMNTASNVGAQTFRNIEVLTVVAFIYLFMTYPIAFWADRLHRRAGRLHG
jgi:glutamine transport system permease protein